MKLAISVYLLVATAFTAEPSNVEFNLEKFFSDPAFAELSQKSKELKGVLELYKQQKCQIDCTNTMGPTGLSSQMPPVA